MLKRFLILILLQLGAFEASAKAEIFSGFEKFIFASTPPTSVREKSSSVIDPRMSVFPEPNLDIEYANNIQGSTESKADAEAGFWFPIVTPGLRLRDFAFGVARIF